MKHSYPKRGHYKRFARGYRPFCPKSQKGSLGLAHKTILPTNKVLSKSRRKSHRLPKVQSKVVDKSSRESRINTEYVAFCQSRAHHRSSKVSRKTINKKNRKVIIKEARIQFTQSVIIRALSNLLNRNNSGVFKPSAIKTHNMSIVNVFAAIYEAIGTAFSELADTEHCEFCGRGFPTEDGRREHISRRHLIDFGNDAFDIVLMVFDLLTGLQN